MSAPAKFLFDMDFTAPANTERPASRAEIAQQVAEAEARAFREGFAAAQREASVESDRRSALAMEEISIAMRALAASFKTVEGRVETEAVDVAVATARKLARELVAAEPLTEIMALVADCLRHLTSTPHIAIRVNDALYDRARERIEDLARRSGFEGRLVILAEPEIEVSDCKIEWADGGCTLDHAATNARIGELVERYMAARNQAGRDS
ncbi:FliH/SctL family protein [Afipia carboxidovorans]|uniref:FliH/SctL family protein n=1 Tax=Afipia carboxidovorans TaxID=40137 RepID=UPI00308ACCC2|nr:FliH/SctL family protein [Afipia carboxidovorans]